VDFIEIGGKEEEEEEKKKMAPKFVSSPSLGLWQR